MTEAVSGDNPFGHGRGAWQAAKQEAAKKLEAVAYAGDLIFYSELCRSISAIRFNPDGHDFHHLLGQLSLESDAAGGGMISALVVHKNGRSGPGSGFFDLAGKLGRDIADRDACWADEVKRVHLAVRRNVAG